METGLQINNILALCEADKIICDYSGLNLKEYQIKKHNWTNAEFEFYQRIFKELFNNPYLSYLNWCEYENYDMIQHYYRDFKYYLRIFKLLGLYIPYSLLLEIIEFTDITEYNCSYYYKMFDLVKNEPKFNEFLNQRITN